MNDPPETLKCLTRAELPGRALERCSAGMLVAVLTLGGCAWYDPAYVPPNVAQPAGPAIQNNPVLVPVTDRDVVWEQVVDVVDDYFKIEREDRVQLIGDTLTEGHLETYARGGSTLGEPWGLDSVNEYDRLESTLQSIRRKAIVRVIPSDGGFLIDVAVLKEFEDVGEPEVVSAGKANLRNDSSLRRYNNPVGGDRPTLGWIPKGRDIALEQTILAQIQQRLAGFAQPRMY